MLDNSAISASFCIIFSGSAHLSKGYISMLQLSFGYAHSKRDKQGNVDRAWSKIMEFRIFDDWILEWLTVALCSPSKSSNGRKFLELLARTLGSLLLGHPV